MREKLELHCDVISGYAFSTSDWREEGIPVVKIGNISNGEDILCDEQTQYVNESFLAKLDEKYHISKGDVLISLTGSHINQPNSMVGRTCRSLTDRKYLLNQRAGKVLPFDNTNKNYLYYLLSTKAVKYDIANRAYGGANQVNVSPKDIKKLKWEFPDLEIQNKIADVLSTYDELIENNNQRIAVLEQMAENLYKEWFIRLRFPGYETAEFENGFPKGWKQIRLGEKMAFIRGKSYSSADIQDGNNILLSMNNVHPYGGFIRDFTRVYGGKYQDKHLIKYGDLLMSITDMTQDRRIIGYVAMFDSDRTDCIMSTHLMKIETDIDHLFILNFFNISGLSKMIAEFATGANVLGLTDSILKRIKAVLPSDELIEKYGKIVKPYYDMIAVIKNENDNLVKQRDLLLPRLMSGKLEV